MARTHSIDDLLVLPPDGHCQGCFARTLASPISLPRRQPGITMMKQRDDINTPHQSTISPRVLTREYVWAERRRGGGQTLDYCPSLRTAKATSQMRQNHHPCLAYFGADKSTLEGDGDSASPPLPTRTVKSRPQNPVLPSKLWEYLIEGAILPRMSAGTFCLYWRHRRYCPVPSK